jgi:hypothetical protein
VDFGENPFAVYRATVDDSMHFDELGKITYITEAFLKPFSDTDSDKLDAYVEKVLSESTLRSSARYHQPPSIENVGDCGTEGRKGGGKEREKRRKRAEKSGTCYFDVSSFFL